MNFEELRRYRKIMSKVQSIVDDLVEENGCVPDPSDILIETRIKPAAYNMLKIKQKHSEAPQAPVKRAGAL